MKVTYIADSTFLFEHDGIRILTDPWIGSAIYNGSWLQFPVPTIRADEIGRLDYIFISHIHEDHCDPKTLSQLDRGAKILLMDRNPNYVEKFLIRQQFNFSEIINISPYQPFAISPTIAIEMIDADPAHSLNHMIDSSMLIHWDKSTIYFANDNPPYPESSRYLRRYRHELALIPASGGSGYPACYDNLSASQKETERQRIIASYFDIFTRTISELEPRFFCAIAGNHVVSGRQAVLNDAMTFLSDGSFAYRYAKEKLSSEVTARCAPLVFREGNCIDLESIDASPDGLWRIACADSDRAKLRNSFIRDVAASVNYDHDDQIVPDDYDFPMRFCSAGHRLFQSATATNIAFDSHIYVELPVSGRKIYGHIDGMKKNVTVEENVTLLEPYLQVRTERKLLYQLLEGKFSWNIADAGCLLRYVRCPNVFDREAFIALNFLRNGSSKE